MTTPMYAAEYVFPGHPDKLCDAIADALVQAAGHLEKRALVGVEVAVHRSRVLLTGRIGCNDASGIDTDALVRQVYCSAGYGSEWGPRPEDLKIGAELCLGPLEEGESAFRELADDQSICTGYAVDIPQTNFLPVEHWLANRLGQKLQDLRRVQPDLRLGPDGKVCCVVCERDGRFFLAQFSCSLQQKARADDIALHRAVRVTLEQALVELAVELPSLDATVPATIHVNGAGAFDRGGPEGDNGLSGKKLVVDAYGPRVAIGGGALSGKDFFKADRAGALHARRLAKAVVMTGAASDALVHLVWVPGEPAARILSIKSGDGDEVPVSNWERLVDLSLAASGENWTGSADLIDIARRGHFTNPAMPWECVHIGSTALAGSGGS